MKKRLFFIVEQLNLQGSAEYLAVMMGSFLSEEYDVFLLSLESINKGKVNPEFMVNSRIRINSLNLPHENRDQVILENRDKVKQELEKSVFEGDIFIFFTNFRVEVLPDYAKKVWVDGFEDFSDYAKFDYTIFLSKRVMEEKKQEYPDLEKRFILLNPHARLDKVENFKYYGNHLFSVTKLEDKSYIDRLIHIVNVLKEKKLKFKLTISCQGTYLKYFNQQIKENKLENIIELVPFGDLRKWFAVADLFIYTSTSKFMPMTIVESIVNSVPVICASKNQYAQELVKNSGVILKEGDDLAQVIINILQDKVNLSKMKFNTYESSYRFALNNPESILINIIKSLEK